MTSRTQLLTALLTFLGASIVSDAGLAQARAEIPPPEPAEADMLVGAYYFPGWSEDHRWYCIKASDTAQHPLLGYYREGDPGAADWHIKWALEHGVSFFAFDFYTQAGGSIPSTVPT